MMDDTTSKQDTASLVTSKQETDGDEDATTAPPERPAAAARLEWGVPPLVVPPSHLPDPAGLLHFDVDLKKSEIFEAVREKIRSKAQYTKNVSSHQCTFHIQNFILLYFHSQRYCVPLLCDQGRKPWTQITINLPIKPGMSDDEDLAVVWSLMHESTRCDVKHSANGDMTWMLWSDDYLKWLNIDPEKTKPVNTFVHPVQYETGARKEMKLQKNIKKAMKDNRSSLLVVEHLEKELSDFQSAQAAKGTPQPIGKDYHWSRYDECLVTYKKKQTRKVVNELQLVVKVRTAYLGWGDPKENNGYLGGASSSILLDPQSQLYNLLKRVGM